MLSSAYEVDVWWTVENVRLRLSEDRKFNYIDLGTELTVEALRLNRITKEECRKAHIINRFRRHI